MIILKNKQLKIYFDALYIFKTCNFDSFFFEL